MGHQCVTDVSECQSEPVWGLTCIQLNQIVCLHKPTATALILRWIQCGIKAAE